MQTLLVLVPPSNSTLNCYLTQCVGFGQNVFSRYLFRDIPQIIIIHTWLLSILLGVTHMVSEYTPQQIIIMCTRCFERMSQGYDVTRHCNKHAQHRVRHQISYHDSIQVRTILAETANLAQRSLPRLRQMSRSWSESVSQELQDQLLGKSDV